MTKREERVLHELLSMLLDRYEGALILIRDHDGTAAVVAGGSNQCVEDGQRYRELIESAPDIIQNWHTEAILARVAEPKKEMN